MVVFVCNSMYGQMTAGSYACKPLLCCAPALLTVGCDGCAVCESFPSGCCFCNSAAFTDNVLPLQSPCLLTPRALSSRRHRPAGHRARHDHHDSQRGAQVPRQVSISFVSFSVWCCAWASADVAGLLLLSFAGSLTPACEARGRVFNWGLVQSSCLSGTASCLTSCAILICEQRFDGGPRVRLVGPRRHERRSGGHRTGVSSGVGGCQIGVCCLAISARPSCWLLLSAQECETVVARTNIGFHPVMLSASCVCCRARRL